VRIILIAPFCTSLFFKKIDFFNPPLSPSGMANLPVAGAAHCTAYAGSYKPFLKNILAFFQSPFGLVREVYFPDVGAAHCTESIPAYKPFFTK
jgi:hypothetical protein